MTRWRLHRALSREHWLLVAVLAIGVLLRLRHVTAPLFDHHSWRQTQTTMIARNLYREGFDLWSPRVDFYCAEFCSESGLLVLEFPLYNAIVALLYKLFGLHDPLGRLVSLGFAVGAAYLLYRLARRFYGATASLIAALFFTISPISVFFGRAFMPEALMIFAGIGALLYFHTWLEDGQWSSFGLALSFAIAAFLVKFSMLHLAIPIAYMAWRRYGRAAVREWRLYLFVGLFLVPSLVWFLHAHNSPNLNMYWLVSRPEHVFDNHEFFPIMWKRLRGDVLTPVGLGLFLFGLLLGLRQKSERMFDVWLVAAIVLVAVMGPGNWAHDYYQLPLVPIASIYIGRAVAYLCETRLFSDLGLRRPLGPVLATVLVAIAIVQSVRIARPWYGEEIPGLHRFAETVKQEVPPGRQVVASSTGGTFEPWDPRLLYAFDRKGWNVRPQELLKGIDLARARDIRYLAIYPTEGLSPDLLADLSTRYRRLPAGGPEGGAIFDLGPPRGRLRL